MPEGVIILAKGAEQTQLKIAVGCCSWACSTTPAGWMPLPSCTSLLRAACRRPAMLTFPLWAPAYAPTRTSMCRAPALRARSARTTLRVSRRRLQRGDATICFALFTLVLRTLLPILACWNSEVRSALRCIPGHGIFPSACWAAASLPNSSKRRGFWGSCQLSMCSYWTRC